MRGFVDCDESACVYYLVPAHPDHEEEAGLEYADLPDEEAERYRDAGAGMGGVSGAAAATV